MRLENFIPYASVTVTPSASSAFTAFPVGSASVGVRAIGNDVLLQNVGTGLAYFRMGVTGTAATANDVALQPGSAMVISLGSGDPNAHAGVLVVPPTGIALISAAGTTVNICMGAGS